MRHPAVATAFLCLVILGAVAPPTSAQQPQLLERELRARGARVETRLQDRAQIPTELDQQRAHDTRDELRRLMELYPPALGRVLRLDPTLMTNAAYLAPYPALATFLQRHPEVPRYSEYFLNFVGESNAFEPRDADAQLRSQAMNMWRESLSGILFYCAFLTVILTLTWLIRFMVSHRRWLRATKIQSDVHGRVLERLGSSEELLAYVQSPAGRNFLQAVPLAADPVGAPGIAAPFGRILLSIQAGLVLVSGGLGLLFIKRYVIEEVAQMMLVFGVLGVSLGAGFALAAGASYMLSQRLGLFDSGRESRTPGA
jgi:hypothetical protein